MGPGPNQFMAVAYNVIWVNFGSHILVIVTRSPVAPAMEIRKNLQDAGHILIIPPRAEGRQYQTWSLKAWTEVLEVAETKNLCKL